MLKGLLLAGLLLLASQSYAQNLGQLAKSKPDTAFSNVLVKPLYSDAEASTFLIWIKTGVKAHKHEQHTEQVYILKGKARMRLNNDWFIVQKGDWVMIPKGSIHAVEVLSGRPLLVVSVQAPQFLGKDRVYVAE